MPLAVSAVRDLGVSSAYRLVVGIVLRLVAVGFDLHRDAPGRLGQAEGQPYRRRVAQIGERDARVIVRVRGRPCLVLRHLIGGLDRRLIAVGGARVEDSDDVPLEWLLRQELVLGGAIEIGDDGFDHAFPRRVPGVEISLHRLCSSRS